MTTNDWLATATHKLKDAKIDTARLDTLVLLADCLHKNQAQVLAEPATQLTIEQQNWLERRLICRQQHEPLAYIRGYSEFYGRDFAVNQHVLVPRAESEAIIDLLKTLKPGAIIDVGCGSGALAITAKLELPKTEVTAMDIDSDCLKLTKQNAANHEVLIKCEEHDLLRDVNLKPKTVILANLPYVPMGYKVNKAATFEPKLALYGGKDGLDLYRQLFNQILTMQQKPQHVIAEALPQQHAELEQVAKENGYKLIKTEGFAQLFAQKV